MAFNFLISLSQRGKRKMEKKNGEWEKEKKVVSSPPGVRFLPSEDETWWYLKERNLRRRHDAVAAWFGDALIPTIDAFQADPRSLVAIAAAMRRSAIPNLTPAEFYFFTAARLVQINGTGGNLRMGEGVWLSRCHESIVLSGDLGKTVGRKSMLSFLEGAIAGSGAAVSLNLRWSDWYIDEYVMLDEGKNPCGVALCRLRETRVAAMKGAAGGLSALDIVIDEDVIRAHDERERRSGKKGGDVEAAVWWAVDSAAAAESGSLSCTDVGQTAVVSTAQSPAGGDHVGGRGNKSNSFQPEPAAEDRHQDEAEAAATKAGGGDRYSSLFSENDLPRVNGIDALADAGDAMIDFPWKFMDTAVIGKNRTVDIDTSSGKGAESSQWSTVPDIMEAFRPWQDLSEAGAEAKAQGLQLGNDFSLETRFRAIDSGSTAEVTTALCLALPMSPSKR